MRQHPQPLPCAQVSPGTGQAACDRGTLAEARAGLQTAARERGQAGGEGPVNEGPKVGEEPTLLSARKCYFVSSSLFRVQKKTTQ